MEYMMHAVYNYNYDLRRNSTTDLTIRQTNHLDPIHLHSSIFMIRFSFLYPGFLSFLYDSSQFVVLLVPQLSTSPVLTYNVYLRFNHGIFGKVMSGKAGPRR